jgi:ATP synthase protein I
MPPLNFIVPSLLSFHDSKEDEVMVKIKDSQTKSKTLEELDTHIKNFHSSIEKDVNKDQNRQDDEMSQRGANMGLGFRIATELVAGIMIGCFFGWVIDRWLVTKPWFMIIFFFLGAAAGVMNAYRVAKKLDRIVGLEK